VKADVDSLGLCGNVADLVQALINGVYEPPAIQNRAKRDVSTVGALINPRLNYGYRRRLVAKLEPESPNPLAHEAKETNAHADKKVASFLFIFRHL